MLKVRARPQSEAPGPGLLSMADAGATAAIAAASARSARVAALGGATGTPDRPPPPSAAMIEEPTSARSGAHALSHALSSRSMAAQARSAMSAAQFYDHLADTGWLTFLASATLFASGDDLPEDVLGGTEMEKARHELLSNELRHTVELRNGDVVVQAEVKSFFGQWTAVLGAASYNNDEVRLLPNTHSATGDALCLRARLEPGAAAGGGSAKTPSLEPERGGGGIFVWQETELTIELDQVENSLGVCQLQRYICGGHLRADTVRHYSFVDRQVAKPRLVAPAAPALPSPDMAWLRFGHCAGYQPPAAHCEWSARGKALQRLRKYMKATWEEYLTAPTTLAPPSDEGGGGGAGSGVPPTMLPLWLGGEHDRQLTRRYRLEDVSNDLMLVVEELVRQTAWEGQLGETSSHDEPAQKWEVRARLSFALEQWRITTNVFSRTGDALVLRTPRKRDNRLAATVSRMTPVKRRASLAPTTSDQRTPPRTSMSGVKFEPTPEPEPEPEAVAEASFSSSSPPPPPLPHWSPGSFASECSSAAPPDQSVGSVHFEDDDEQPFDSSSRNSIGIDVHEEMAESYAARRVLQSSGFEAGAWLTELRTVSLASSLSRPLPTSSAVSQRRASEVGIGAGGEVEAEVEVTVSLYTQGLTERWRCPPGAKAGYSDQRPTAVRRQGTPSSSQAAGNVVGAAWLGRRRGSVDDSALVGAMGTSTASQGGSDSRLWKRRGSVDSTQMAARKGSLGGGALSAVAGAWGGATATLETVRDRRWVTSARTDPSGGDVVPFSPVPKRVKWDEPAGADSWRLTHALSANLGVSPRRPIAVGGGLGGGGAMRRRAAASPLLKQLRRPHRFHAGDEASELACGGASGAKMIGLGLTLGMAVPVPGFALIGGLAGAMLAAPAVQQIVVRYIRNHSIQRFCMISPQGSEDLRLTVDLASKGHSAFVQSAIFSLEAGDWSLSGAGERERLTLRQRVELTNRCIGVVEDTYALEPILSMSTRSAGASLGEYGKEAEAAGDDGRGTRHYQLVCRQRICVGSTVVATTLRTYRFDSEVEDELPVDDTTYGTEIVGELEKGVAQDVAEGREEAETPPPPPPSP